MLWPSGNKSVSVEKRQRERIPSAEHVLYQIFNMVKKGEKGKKAKKMKKESKNAQKKDKMTFGEALLAYQIRIKETTIEELLVEVKQIEEKNTRCTERNDRLKTEQLGHINALLKAAKAQEKELTKKEVVNREQVDLAMREKWDYFRKKEHLFEEIHSEINHLAKQTVEKLVEKDYWLGYKNVTSIEHVKQIQLLQAVIEDIKQNSTEINEYFQKSLEATKTKITKETEKLMDETKEMATEEAVKYLDKESRQAIKENDWLKKEVEVYRKDVHDFEESVYKIEQENLELISQLFDCRLEELKISRNVFLTQAVGLEVPADGLLGEDLAKLKLGTDADVRPKSKTLAAVEKKVFSIEILSEEEEESPGPVDFSHIYEDEKDFQEYLQLGPLEIKLLSLVGQTMPIHHEEIEMKSRDHMDERFNQNRSKWLVTPRIRSDLKL